MSSPELSESTVIELEKFLTTLSDDELALLNLEIGKPGLEAEEDQIWEKCQASMWYFVRHFCRSINMHFEENALDPDVLPTQTIDLFPDYPHIKRVVGELETPCNALIEKSRDMMATWTMSAIFLHDLIFQEGAVLLMASRRFDDVDDGGEESTPDSLLGRVKFIYDNLPEWMRKRKPFKFKTGLISCPENRSYVVGVKAVKHTGRQGKYRRALADEFGHWDYGEANLASLRYAAQSGLILLSTPPMTGRHHCFGRLAVAGAPGFDKITLHWREHPLRTPEWYAEASKGMQPQEIAQELDISYSGSVEGKVFPTFERATHVLSSIPFNPEAPLHLTFDHGLNEETAILMQIYDDKWWIIDEYQYGYAHKGRKTTPWEARDDLIDEVLTKEPYNFHKDEAENITGLGYCTGDPSGKTETLAVQSRKTDDTRLTSFHAVYAQRGIRIRSKYSKIKDGVGILRDLLNPNQPRLFVAEKCYKTWDSFIHHRWKEMPGQPGTFQDMPVHDWTSHYMAAVRYFAVNTTSVILHRQNSKPKYKQVWAASRTGARYPILVELGS